MQEGNHAMTEPTNAVVPVPQGAITFGQSNLTGDQLIPPRVKIVQAMSEERAAGAAEAGEFWNTLTSENLGNTIRFVPIFTFMNRVFMIRDEKRAAVDEILIQAEATVRSAMQSEWEETRVTWYLGANSDMSGDLVVAQQRL